MRRAPRSNSNLHPLGVARPASGRRRGVVLLSLILTAPVCLGLAPGFAQTPAAEGDAATGGDAAAIPELAPSDREAAARDAVEDSERVRAMQVDNQRAATEQAAQALAEEKRLTVEQSAAFDRLKRAEAAVDELTQHLEDLNQRRAAAQSRLDKTAAALQRLLPVIIRMSEHPLETIIATAIASGLSFEDTLRGYFVLRGIARQIAADARASTEDRKALDAATTAAADLAPRLAAAQAARSFEADSLAHQLADTKERRAAAEQEAADAARRAAAEAARADTLRSMLQILEIQRRLEEARATEDLLRAERDQKTAAAEAARLRQAALTRPAGAGTIVANAKPAGQMIPPVIGTLLRGWGDPDEGGPAVGQSWQTESGAWVVAPCGGTVAFAEPFHGYGLLIIIDCGGGYHVVLGGLDKISVVPGRAVQAGEPIATMRPPAPSGIAPGVAADSPSGGPDAVSPILYFELRKAGRPINPAPWLKQDHQSGSP